jgi:hypothetical protein
VARCDLCRLDVEPKKGKCPRCGARLDWGTRAAPAPRPGNRRPVIVALVVVAFVAAVAWTIWHGRMTESASSSDAATSKEKVASACDGLSAKLLSGKALSGTDLETFKSQCVKTPGR